jgi:hypothetical protein
MKLPDRWPEKGSNIAPCGRHDAARRGEADSAVRIPERAPDTGWNCELEHRNRPSGAHDSSQFGQRRARVIDVAQEIGEGEVVEGAVVEGKCLRRGLDELGPTGKTLARDRQHLGRLVETDDRMTAREESLRNKAGPGRDVEHTPAVGGDSSHQIAAPERVLPERQRGSDSMVGRSERAEEIERMALPGGLHGPILARVTLTADLERIAATAAGLADEAKLTAVLPVEVMPGRRAYLLAFGADDSNRTWLAVNDAGSALTDRRDVRDVVSIAALCEIAEEAAFPGDLDELRAQLVALRFAESPEGIEEAEAAARELQLTLGAPPTVASPERLDAIGQAARKLELELDPMGSSPFAGAMRSAQVVADELWKEVESTYRVPLK